MSDHKYVINEGLLKSAFDVAAVEEIIRRLGTPFTQTPAYATGVIDGNGDILIPKNKRTPAQRASMTSFDVMMFNLKKLLGKVTHSTNITPVIASLLLLKEHRQLTQEHVDVFMESVRKEYLPDYVEYLNEDGEIANVSAPAIPQSPSANVQYPEVPMPPPIKTAGLTVTKLKKAKYDAIRKAMMSRRRRPISINESRLTLYINNDNANESYLVCMCEK